MNKSTKLDFGEKEYILGLLHEAWIEHSSLAKLKFLAGEYTQSKLDWNFAHAKWIKEMETKLLILFNETSPNNLKK